MGCCQMLAQKGMNDEIIRPQLLIEQSQNVSNNQQSHLEIPDQQEQGIRKFKDKNNQMRFDNLPFSNSDQMYKEYLRAESRRKSTAIFTQSYEKIKILSKGSFGIVWLVQNKQSQKYFVAKFINLANIPENTLNRFFNESRNLKLIDQPNILGFQDDFIDDILYIQVFQYYEGQSLRDYMQTKSQISCKKAFKIFFQIIKALDYINSRNIVHRDIKPENLLFYREFGQLPIVLVDFGGLAFIQRGKNFTKLIGTPAYIAPEVINRSYNSKCDVWSAGVILFEMLGKLQAAGYNPFTSFNIVSTFNKIKSHDPDFRTLTDTGLQWKQMQLIMQLLNKSPDKRPSAKWLWLNRSNYLIDEEIRQYEKPNYSQWANIMNLPYLQKLIMKFLIQNVIPNDIQQHIIDRFILLDDDNDGYITKQDLVTKQTHWYLQNVEINDSNLFTRERISYAQYVIYTIDWRSILTEQIIQIAYQKLIKEKHIRKILMKVKSAKREKFNFSQLSRKFLQLSFDAFKEFLLDRL